MARLIAAIFCLFASVASAQVWAPTRVDDGHFIYHTARSGSGFAFACFAPSPQGKTAWEVGAHEVEATAQGTIRLEIDLRLIPVRGDGGQARRSDVILWIDQVGYRLPEMTYSDFYGYWGVAVGWDDALFPALRGARAVILAPGTDPAWQLPVTALDATLTTLRAGCAADWSAASEPPAGSVAIPAQVNARITQGCSGPAPLPPDAIQAGDLDADGLADFVLDWGAINCPGAMPRPFCGAANCSHDVFLSSRGYAPPVEFLGTRLVIVPHRLGGLALQRGGTFSLCGAQGELCATPYQWNGATFVERP